MTVNRTITANIAVGLERLYTALAAVASSAHTAIGLFLLFVSSYLLTLTRYYTYDAISYALQVRQFAEIGAWDKFIHPHHVLFGPLGFISWRLLAAADPAIDSLTALQVMNAVFASAGVALTYIFLRDGGIVVGSGANSKPASERQSVHVQAFAAALTLGCANAYWIAATDGRVNMPGIVALMVLVALFWGMLRRPSWLQCGLCAAASTLAIGLHQCHGLALIAGIGTMLCSSSVRRKQLRWTAGYLVITFFGIVLMYVVAGAIAGHTDTADVLRWSLAYARDGRWWDFSVARNLWKDVDALTHVFVTRLPTESASGGSIWAAFLHHTLCAATQAILLLTAAGVALRLRTGAKQGNQEWHTLLILALLALPYAAFFTVWNPGYSVFWLPPALAIVWCIGLILPSSGTTTRCTACIVVVVWAVTCAATNLGVTIVRRTHADNPMLTIAGTLGKRVLANDAVLVTGAGYQGSADVYLPYFAGVQVLSLNIALKDARGNEEAVVQIVRDEIASRITSGGRMIVLDEIDSRDAWRNLAHTYGVSGQMAQRILAGYVRIPFVPCGTSQSYLLQPSQ